MKAIQAMYSVLENRLTGMLRADRKRSPTTSLLNILTHLAITVSILSRTTCWGFSTEFVVHRANEISIATRWNVNRCGIATTGTVILRAWEGRSRFWMDEDMQCCAPEELAVQMGVDLPSNNQEKHTIDDSTHHVPKLGKVHVNNGGDVIAVEINSALTEEQATSLQELALSLRNHDFFGRTQFENRSFGPGKGGNDVTYLAPLLQALRPDIASKVVSLVELAYDSSNWKSVGHTDGAIDTKLPQPSSLGIRTSEHLIYDGWKNLDSHKDIGSIYTIVVALRHPNSYGGGQFFLHTSLLEQTEVKPDRLSAIVFLSNTIHGVRQITDGIRESFVTELWIHDDAPLGMNRPTPEEWEEFLAQMA